MTDLTDIEISEFTGVLSEVAETAGATAALLLARCYGGLELYVPRRVAAGHPLVEAVGREVANILVELYGGSHIEVPMGPEADAGRKRRQIVRLIEQGKTNPQIARAVHCHIRTVRRVRSASRLRSRQQDLFCQQNTSHRSV